MFDRILVPLDGSETAEAILGQVIRLLRINDAQVFLFQAVPMPAQPGMEGSGHFLADLRADATRYISSVESRLRDRGVKARGIVRVCGEATGILEAARLYRATLIAMATHGRTSLSRFMFGSVTEKVLRASDVPVLVMRSYKEVGADATRMSPEEVPIRRVLMPVDGSERSLEVLPYVRKLATAVGASVLVLGVVSPEGSKSAGEGEPLIRIAVEDLKAHNIPVDPLVRLGDPACEILEASQRHNADLIAMATHGRSGISRWVMGSVTEKVVRAATVPLLIVRAERTRSVEVEIPHFEVVDSPVRWPLYE